MSFYDMDETYVHRYPYLENTAIVEMDDYGLYSIRLERGITPDAFDGKFTSLSRVEEVIAKAAKSSRSRPKKQE